MRFQSVNRNGGFTLIEQFMVFQVQLVMDGTDVVGLRLDTTPAYAWSWQ